MKGIAMKSKRSVIKSMLINSGRWVIRRIGICSQAEITALVIANINAWLCFTKRLWRQVPRHFRKVIYSAILVGGIGRIVGSCSFCCSATTRCFQPNGRIIETENKCRVEMHYAIPSDTSQFQDKTTTAAAQ